MNNDCTFGSINVETGEFKSGYIDKNGDMKYKQLPWYKRFFINRPEKIEYVCYTTMYTRLIWSNKKHYFDVAVYKKYNPYTNKIYQLYASHDDNIIYFDINAFNKTGDLIMI